MADFPNILDVGSDGWRLATKTVTFTGAAGAGESGSPIALFTVAGGLVDYLAPVSVECVTNLDGGSGEFLAGPDGLGISGVSATGTAGQVWDGDGSWGTYNIADAASEKYRNSSITGSVETANIVSGSVRLRLWWRPRTPGATLVAA